MTERRPIVRAGGEDRQMRPDEKIPVANIPDLPKNIDGGSPESVYLADQSIDGGDENG